MMRKQDSVMIPRTDFSGKVIAFMGPVMGEHPACWGWVGSMLFSYLLHLSHLLSCAPGQLMILLISSARLKQQEEDFLTFLTYLHILCLLRVPVCKLPGSSPGAQDPGGFPHQPAHTLLMLLSLLHYQLFSLY